MNSHHQHVRAVLDLKLCCRVCEHPRCQHKMCCSCSSCWLAAAAPPCTYASADDHLKAAMPRGCLLFLRLRFSVLGAGGAGCLLSAARRLALFWLASFLTRDCPPVLLRAVCCIYNRHVQPAAAQQHKIQLGGKNSSKRDISSNRGPGMLDASTAGTPHGFNTCVYVYRMQGRHLSGLFGHLHPGHGAWQQNDSDRPLIL